ncbi:MAG: SdrD B-like domain-containing protein, partial [Thermodesulfobacteriota bacterium]
LFTAGTDKGAGAGLFIYLDIIYPDGTRTTVNTLTDSDGLYLFPNLLIDEHHNGIGSGGPTHSVRLNCPNVAEKLPGFTCLYALYEQNTDSTTVGGATTDEDGVDVGSDFPAAEPAYPPMGSTDTTNDFGFFVASSIGNYVWDDTNGNGLQDGNESGHQGIRVHLLDAAGNPVEDPALPGTDYVVSTDADGKYLFKKLLPGSYQVKFTLPTGSSFTGQNSGDDSVDSDPNPATGLVSVTIGAEESNLSIDAGLIGPAINIEKLTNNVDADTPAAGPSIVAGNPVSWKYVVTNTGNSRLTQVSVSDDQGVTVTCPQDVLNVGESMTCNASGTAAVGQYRNIGEVVASPPTGSAAYDSDPSHYMGTTSGPAIDIEKSTNTFDADTESGPVVSVGSVMVWNYRVTNIGDETLININVTDNQGVTVSCPYTTLDTGASMDCTGFAPAIEGQYANNATVQGTGTSSGEVIADSDPSHYYAVIRGTRSAFGSLHLEKSTNNDNADSAPGPTINAGDQVTWTYVITNLSVVELTNVTVTDDKLADSDIHCPYDGNRDNRITLMAPESEVICEATLPADAMGQYKNTATVTGTPPVGPDISDSDPSHYFGKKGAISIEKSTNGSDADIAPGPTVKTSQDPVITWSYYVTNTGNVPLLNVTVSDDQGVSVSCPKTELAVAEAMTCSGEGKAEDGQYKNIGSVSAVTSWGQFVSDSDPSHYFGKSFNWALIAPIFIPRCPPVPDYCYLVADGDNEGSRNSPLFTYTFETDKMEFINRLGAPNVEAIVLSLDGETLYGTDAGVLGIIDPTRGIENSFSPIDPTAVHAGTGRGKLGHIAMNDIDGLAWNPIDGILYATNRYGDGVEGTCDLLIKLDATTGRIIPNGFGRGVDYLVIDARSVGATDVDDIAIGPLGTIYAVVGTSGGVGNDHLVTINKNTGKITDQGELHLDGNQVHDMEGLTLYNARTLYGTSGIEYSYQGIDNTLYMIKKYTGETTKINRLDQNFNGYIPIDFEAIECFPVCGKLGNPVR